jgi:hypothetical protein
MEVSGMGEVKEAISERDKPFVLALVAAGITVVEIALVALGKMSSTDGLVTFATTLTAGGFGYYFGKKQ